MTNTPKPAPATPAATPMAATRELTPADIDKAFEDASPLIMKKGAFSIRMAELLNHALGARCFTCARCGNGPIVVKDILCQICAPPAAAQPQRESEQPEQARREALEEAAVEVLKWSEFDDSTTQRSRLCQNITRLIAESIRALADTSLSPQTDSQEMK